jgi:hypothetical protein
MEKLLKESRTAAAIAAESQNHKNYPEIHPSFSTLCYD